MTVREEDRETRKEEEREEERQAQGKLKSLTCSTAFLITLPTSCRHSGMSGLNSSRLGEKDKSRDLKNSVEENRNEERRRRSGGKRGVKIKENQPLIHSGQWGCFVIELCQLSFHCDL